MNELERRYEEARQREIAVANREFNVNLTSAALSLVEAIGWTGTDGIDEPLAVFRNDVRRAFDIRDAEDEKQSVGFLN